MLGIALVLSVLFSWRSNTLTINSGEVDYVADFFDSESPMEYIITAVNPSCLEPPTNFSEPSLKTTGGKYHLYSKDF